MLGNFFNKIVGWFRKDKSSSIAKPDIIQHIDTLISSYNSNIRMFNNDSDIYEAIVKSIDHFRNDRNRIFIQAYIYFVKKLNSTAQRFEHKAVCSSFIEVMKTIQHGLVEIRHEVNQLIQSPEINEHNLKVSHASIMYFIRLADTFDTTFAYLLTGLCVEAPTGEDPDYTSIPKYRIKEVEKYIDLCAFMINQHFTFNVFKDVKSSIDELKKEGKDLLLFLNDGNDNVDLVDTLNAGTPLIKGFNIGNIIFMNPFLVMGRAYRDMVHMKMLKKKKEKEWMQARMAFLKAKMNGLDPQSEEYIALANAVEQYEKQITELDAELAKYFIDEE